MNEIELWKWEEKGHVDRDNEIIQERTKVKKTKWKRKKWEKKKKKVGEKNENVNRWKRKFQNKEDKMPPVRKSQILIKGNGEI